jgi:prepilin-type N-terminal cleavage/methylation domain-containing protein
VSAVKRQSGFSLVEVLVVMAIFAIIIIAASQTFIDLLANAKTQAKITATNIEGVLGLEVLRRDVAHAGYGLYFDLDPSSMPATVPPYSEVTSNANGAALNDAPAGIPRPLVFGGGRGLNGSDWIAVKSVNVAANSNSEHYNYLYTSPAASVNVWTPASFNIDPNDYVVVMRPDQSHRYLMFTTAASGNQPSDQMQNVLTNYAPDTTSIIFSLGTSAAPRMPFNRADYYLANTAMPSRCAAGTGVLYKAVVNQAAASTGYLPAIPILDCVADMQVAYRYDSTGGNYANTVADVTADQPATADGSRQIREVRVYILAQEGQRDNTYTYPNQVVRVGEINPPNTYTFGRNFDFVADGGIADWQHYRWKLYTLIVEPMCLLNWGI